MHLEKLFQECYAICPLVHIIEGVQALLDLLGVLFVLWVGRVQLLGGRWLYVNPVRVHLNREGRLTPFAGFGGWLGGSRSASM